MNDFWEDLTGNPHLTLIGMVHLLPLPGSPGYSGSMSGVLEAADRDVSALVEGGLEYVMFENFYDCPFYPGRVPAETVASMTRVVTELAPRVPRGFGVNVLRNDGVAAIAIAAATGASFVRVNVLSGVRIADQGLIQAEAHEVLRLRKNLGLRTCLLADVDVKHSYPISSHYQLSAEAQDVVQRGGADALVISGVATGQEVPGTVWSRIPEACQVPWLAGSGVRWDNLKSLAPHCQGAIVGASLKATLAADERIDVARVRQLVQAAAAT